MDPVRVSAIISGKVQGVWYRDSTCNQAHAIGELSGWVKNQPDGSVKMVVEGPQEKVQALLKWCETGPPMARVKSVIKQDESYLGEFEDFSVRY